jgi:hypothetical protein
MHTHCARKGIFHRTTTPYSSVRNGKAERRIGIIIADTRTLLIDSGLRPTFWAYAAAHAAYIRNRVPNKDGDSPHSKVMGAEPRLDHLKPFGCAAYVWIPEAQRTDRKLNARALRGIFLGFEPGTHNARIFDPVGRKHLRSRDVKYQEEVFPARKEDQASEDLSFLEGQWESHTVRDLQRNEDQQAEQDDDEDDLPIPELQTNDDQPEAAAAPEPQQHAPRQKVVFDGVYALSRPKSSSSSTPSTSSSVPLTPAAQLRAQTRDYQERARAIRERRDARSSDDKSGIPAHRVARTQGRPVIIEDSGSSDDESGSGDESIDVDEEEASIESALVAQESQSAFIAQEAGAIRLLLEGDDADGWRASIQKELDSIRKAGVFEIVEQEDLPPGTRPIDSRLVHTVKVDPTGGSAHVLKTRLVAKGFSQRPGLDYTETFSPVGHRQSLRLLASIVAQEDLEFQGLDISTAFLHGDLHEELYMRLPRGSVGDYDGKIVRLRKSLYGLKQAGRCWNEKLDAWLKAEGWVPNDNDACLYVHSGEDSRMYLYVHVDDCGVAGQSNAAISAFIDRLNAVFPCKRQGAIQYFLGMEVIRRRDERKIWLTLHQYTKHKLEQFGLSSCKTHDIPIGTSVAAKLVKGTEEEHRQADHLPFRQLTGSLQYLATMTRPDISWAVNKLSSYNSCWTEGQFKLAKGILRYVAGTADWGLCLGGKHQDLVGYVDADFNGCRDTYRSTTGWLVKFGEGVVAWKSKKQAIVSHSTAESEYMALDDVSRDLVWERRGLGLLGVKSAQASATPVKVDNQAALFLAANRTSHDSTKHIAYRYHYIRDLIDAKTIQPSYIATDQNLSDILTKALPQDRFEQHRAAMGVSAPADASGSVSTYASAGLEPQSPPEAVRTVGRGTERDAGQRAQH